jgi:hypothetical protein
MFSTELGIWLGFVKTSEFRRGEGLTLNTPLGKPLVTVLRDQIQAVWWVVKRSQVSSMAAVEPTARRPHLLGAHHTYTTPGDVLSVNVLGVSRFALTKSNKSAQIFPCPPLVR